MKWQIIKRIMAVVSLGTTGYCIYTIIKHVIDPGWNTGFTRILIFATIGTIPLSFLTIFVGARAGVWPALKARFTFNAHGSKFWYWYMLIGMFILGVIMPLAMLILVWISMVELDFGWLFLMYFVPMIIRLLRSSPRDAIIFTGIIIGNFFVSAFISLIIIVILENNISDYQQWSFKKWGGSVQEVMEENDEESSTNMFMWICVYALIAQLIEFVFAVKTLFGKAVQQKNPDLKK